jgi:predicted TPR repeat methyltransferase
VLRPPRHLLAREQVLRALVLLGELDQAAQMYRDWLAEEPDNPVVQHQLAACLQGLAERGAQPVDAPSRASDAYVETLFDHFAGSFDAKLANLHYQAPERVAEAVRSALGEPRAQADVADLGCGTGLCGPRIRPWARRLAGCDLSVGMLRQVRQRRVYDALHKAELVYYLDTQPAHFDLLTCADTLCYFGDLQAVMQAARRALHPSGHFVFTVEGLADRPAGGAHADAPGHRLQTSGRYAHHGAYLQAAALAAGFIVTALQPATLRDEAGEAVRGWVVTLTAPPAP